jgi:hypothetical protein
VDKLLFSAYLAHFRETREDPHRFARVTFAASPISREECLRQECGQERKERGKGAKVEDIILTFFGAPKGMNSVLIVAGRRNTGNGL